ncbi:nitrile hydratase subunit beta [Zavarzinia sp. CC-PAN008]|uniref:nitrile hydratase subunit beta n=1 Tax=Zavarzinia sp. CC-PAN008 TaxID=3243332 RepID=UPI003F74A85D
MDGVHDMGGMHGFGAVAPDADETVFHAAWEGRVFAMNMLSGFVVPSSADQFRRTLERMPPAAYLAASYYEKWLAGLTARLLEAGAVTEEELADGQPRQALPPALAGRPAGPAAAVPAVVAGGASQAAPGSVPARFKAGDRVLTRSTMGYGHNRLPRYARGRVGTVERVLGTYLLADAHAEGEDRPEWSYTVVFAAPDLWGAEADPRDSLTLDLWDSYLEPAP